MEYQIITSKKKKIVIVIYKKKVRMKRYLQIANEAGTLLIEKGWNRLIIDVRNLLSLFSIIEEYTLTTKSADLFPIKFRIAILSSEIKKEDTAFMKKIFLNHDIFFETFPGFEEALKWLFQKEIKLVKPDIYCEKDS